MVTYSEAGVDISLEEQTVSALTGELSETLNYRNIIKNKDEQFRIDKHSKTRETIIELFNYCHDYRYF